MQWLKGKLCVSSVMLRKERGIEAKAQARVHSPSPARTLYVVARENRKRQPRDWECPSDDRDYRVMEKGRRHNQLECVRYQ